jgi:hypothetical protein
VESAGAVSRGEKTSALQQTTVKMTARCPPFGDDALFADYPGDAWQTSDGAYV